MQGVTFQTTQVQLLPKGTRSLSASQLGFTLAKNSVAQLAKMHGKLESIAKMFGVWKPLTTAKITAAEEVMAD